MKYWFFHFVDRYLGISLSLFLFFVKRLANNSPKSDICRAFGKILIIKLSMMGDTILLIPAIRAISTKYPNARISMLCSDINYEVVRTCPYVDEIFAVKINSIFNPLYLFSLLKTIGSNYDLAIDFEQWFRFSALVAYFSKAVIKIGFKTKNQLRHLLFDFYIEHKKNLHEIDCYFELLKLVGIENKNRKLEIFAEESDSQSLADKISKHGLNDAKKLIIIHPGSSHWFQKQWPKERYIQLSEQLLNKYVDSALIFTGSASEKTLVENIIAGIKQKRGESVISFAGQLSLPELSALIKKGSLFISGNTGVMHLACAVGTPVVCINGPVSDAKWGPVNLRGITVNAKISCAPCVYLGFDYGCKTNKCMRSIEINEVMNAADTMIRRGSKE